MQLRKWCHQHVYDSGAKFDSLRSSVLGFLTAPVVPTQARACCARRQTCGDHTWLRDYAALQKELLLTVDGNWQHAHGLRGYRRRHKGSTCEEKEASACDYTDYAGRSQKGLQCNAEPRHHKCMTYLRNYHAISGVKSDKVAWVYRACRAW